MKPVFKPLLLAGLMAAAVSTLAQPGPGAGGPGAGPGAASPELRERMQDRMQRHMDRSSPSLDRRDQIMRNRSSPSLDRRDQIMRNRSSVFQPQVHVIEPAPIQVYSTTLQTLSRVDHRELSIPGYMMITNIFKSFKIQRELFKANQAKIFLADILDAEIKERAPAGERQAVIKSYLSTIAL